VSTPAGTVDEYWDRLVTAALLGTDRREPPVPPPGAIADLIADTVRHDGASRMLAAVAAVAAVRRAAFVPGPPADPLHPPPPDRRPWCAPAAVATWRVVVREWPVLEDEWVLTVVERGLRLPPDALVELLRRHRADTVRRARVALAGGPVVDWLVGHVPELAATPAGGRGTVPADAVASLPHLPLPPELADLAAADAHTFVGRLVPGFGAGVWGAPHRAVLVNLVARCRPAVLLDAADQLERTHVGLALALADLARLRHRMLAELGVTP
jgi:hypothetical protein